MSVYPTLFSTYAIGSRLAHKYSELIFNKPDSNLFISIQNQNFIGKMDTTLRKDKKLKNIPLGKGDSFYTNNITSLTVYYHNNGGAHLYYWQIPEGVCSDANVYSGFETDLTIEFEANQTMNKCWFLNFADVPSYNVTFETSGNDDSSLFMVTNESFVLDEPIYTNIPSNSGYILGKTTEQIILSFKKLSNEGTTKVRIHFTAKSKGKDPVSPIPFKEFTLDGLQEHDIGENDITYKRNYNDIIIAIVAVVVVAVGSVYVTFAYIRPYFNNRIRQQYLAKLTPEEREKFFEYEKKYNEREKRRKLRQQRAKQNKGKQPVKKDEKTKESKEKKDNDKDDKSTTQKETKKEKTD